MRTGPTYKLLTHPFLLGAVLTGLVLLFWRPDISAYRVTDEGYERMSTSRRLYFFDLDQDGESEEIAIDHHPPMLKILVMSGNRVRGQYNLTSQPLNHDFINAGDFNGDGLSELYLFTMHHDSLLLSIIDPLGSEGAVLLEEPFFYNDTITFDTDVPQVFFLGFMENDRGVNRQLYFAVNTGFSKRPRSVFRYDVGNHKIYTSPLSAAPVHDPLFSDLSGDSYPEMIFSTTAPDNYTTPFPYTDHNIWLMVLDHRLDFVFEPVRFPGPSASMQVLPIQMDGISGLVGFYHLYGKDSVSSSLFLVDSVGNIFRSEKIRYLDRFSDFLSIDHSGPKPVICLLDARRREVTRFNTDLEEIERDDLPALLDAKLFRTFDLDDDGHPEYLFYGEKPGSVVIFREGMKDPVEIDLGQDHYPENAAKVYAGGTPLLYLQFSQEGYKMSYRWNPYHFLTYPLILAIYLGISLLVLAIYRLQMYRAKMRFLTEKKINELQILNLKNQIDPHFTFNILNSIGSMYTLETDKNRAYELFVRYSKMLRYSLQNSDKVTVSLEEELNFVRNYIELEKSRRTPGFSWEIRVEEQVDRNKMIPRMIIHSFVENAIKHGVDRAGGQGALLIAVSRSSHGLQISVEDNGPGPQKKIGIPSGSSGKGLKIIDDLILLFHQLEGIRIQYMLQDLSEIQPGRTGTRATVIIPD